MRKSSRLIALTLLLLASAAVASPPPIRTPHFVVSYSQGDEADAKRVAQYAEFAFERVSRDLGFAPAPYDRSIPITVYTTRPEFEAGGGVDRRRTVVGRAWSGTDRIDIDASGAYAVAELVTAHEVTHIITARLLGQNARALPLWANEGIARSESGEANVSDDEIVGQAIADGDYIPFGNIESEFPTDSRGAGIAYAESTSFIRYIVGLRGKDALRRILGRVADGEDFDHAVIDVIGRSVGGMEKDWKRSVAKTYAGNWLFRNSATVIGIAMVLLCLAAYAAVKRKQRRHSIEWAEDEYDDGLDYGPPPE